jgi:carbonic anhydrase
MMLRAVVVTVLLLLLTACTPGAGGPTAFQSAPSPSPVHWSYEGEEGPEHWGELSPDYELCATGSRQSPIDIANPIAADLANVVFDYQPAPLEIVNNGHTIQVSYAPGSSIQLEGTAYQLLQFHFHAPSEHLISGEAAGAELHLVHRGATGELAVVGVLLAEAADGADNPVLATVWSNLPQTPGPARQVDTQVDAEMLMPANRLTFRYQGSLTTPPCSEGVSWLMITESVAIGTSQLEQLTSIIEGNNRPIQPLNDRQLVEDTTP